MDLLPRARWRLAVVVFLIIAAVPALAAERVSVSGAVTGGAGHLEFDWPQAVDYDARIVFGRLLVRFSKPAEFDFSAFEGAMPQYLGEPKVVADDTVVAFPLQVPVTLKHNQDGTRITIELYDEQGLTALSTAAGPAAESGAESGEEPSESVEPTDLLAATAPKVASEVPADTPSPAQVEVPAEVQTDTPTEAQAEAPPETVAEPPADTQPDVSGDAPPEAVPDGPQTAASLDQPALETAAGPAAPETLETIGLRIGEHPGYTRLVFDWPSDVSYRIEQRGRRVILNFAAPADLDLSAFRRRPPADVFEITVRSGAAGLTVTLRLSDEFLVRHFLDGPHVVVDVVDDAETARLAPSLAVTELVPLPDSPPAPTSEVSSEVSSGLASVTASGTAPKAVRAPAAVPTPEAVPAPEAVPLAPVSKEALPTSGADTPDRDQPSDQPQTAAIEPAMTPTGGQGPKAGEADGGEPSGPAPADADQAMDEAGVLAQAELGAEDSNDTATATFGSQQPVVLRFEWPGGPGRAAAFRRGRRLWIVFDQPLAEEAGREIAEAVPELAPVERLTDEDETSATILRFNLPWAFVPDLRRAERAWIVRLQPKADEPQTGLALEYLTDSGEPRIRFTVEGSAGVLRVRDPDLDDMLEIVPLPVAGVGLKRERQFLQFRALATYQGLAIIPLSDGLIVESGEKGVEVRDSAGLLISPGTDRDRALRNNKDFESGMRLTEPEAVRQADSGRVLVGRAGDRLFDSRNGERQSEVAAAHALRTLRQAAQNPLGVPETADAAATPGALFTAVMLGAPSNRFAPFTAFTLYQKYKDLTPAGSAGDRLITHLADRLIAADELEPASDLLWTQVAHRLSGEEKVWTGARLALIRLLQDEPVPALTALNASLPEAGFASLPPALERDRRHLRARALASLGRHAEARALLDGDDSTEALRLEAELLWAEQDWPAMAGTLEKLTPPPGREQPLSESDGEVLVDLAVAYGLAGRREDVTRIGERYGAAMADTDWHDEFVKLTGPIDKSALIALADELAGSARLAAFKARFRDRLASGRTDTAY